MLCYPQLDCLFPPLLFPYRFNLSFRQMGCARSKNFETTTAKPYKANNEIETVDLIKEPPEQLLPSLIESNDSTFTEEEITALKATRDLLLSSGYPPEKISIRELLIVVMNCKLHADSAAEKYKKWLDAMSDFGIKSFDDIWDGVSRDGQSGDWSTVESLLTAYAGCGRDKQDRSVMWIRTRPVQVHEEVLAIKSASIYFSAIHADLKSLRNGITFVLDINGNDMTPVGNEAKLQRTWQSIPLRPKRIYITGAGYVQRLLINAAIQVASLFTKEKVLQRIRFADLDEIRTEVDSESLPTHVGGGSAIKTNEELLAWTRKRLADFPTIPPL